MSIFPTHGRGHFLTKISLIAIIAGCTELPQRGSLDTELPTRFSAATDEQTGPRLMAQSWWSSFADPAMNALVDKVLAQNLTLQAARLRVQEAQLRRNTAPSPVTLDTQLSATAAINSETRTTDTSGALQANFNWLLDPFGERRAQAAILLTNAQIAEAEEDAANLLVISDLLNTYVDLRFQQRRVAILQRQIGAGRRLIDQQNARLNSGAGTELQLVELQASLQNRRAELPQARAQVGSLIQQINVLVGTTGGDIGMDITVAQDQPQPDGAFGVGVPLALLAARPDIEIQALAYYNSVLRVTQANAARYPRLSVGGALRIVGNGSVVRSLSLTPTVALPTLPLTQASAGVSAAEKAAEVALVEWREAVVEAVADVETALIRFQGAGQALSAAREAVGFSQRRVRLANTVFQNGSGTVDQVNDAQDQLLGAQLRLAELRRDYGTAYIALQTSLGVLPNTQADMDKAALSSALQGLDTQ